MRRKERKKTILAGQDKNVVILTKVSRHHLVFEKKIEVSEFEVSVIPPPVQVNLY